MIILAERSVSDDFVSVQPTHYHYAVVCYNPTIYNALVPHSYSCQITVTQVPASLIL